MTTGTRRSSKSHRELLRVAFQEAGGYEVTTQGDAFLVAFKSAKNAVSAAVAAQRALVNHPLPERAVLRVRMALHAGEPVTTFGEYMGLDVHRSARICAAGHGGQILLSEAARALVEEHLPADVRLQDLGVHRLKDLQRPEHLFQLIHPDLPADFPPLKFLNSRSQNLPLQLSSFINREREMQEVKEWLAKSRLVTLNGTGGVGKTRLALHVGADILNEFDDGVWCVELAALSDPALAPQTVAMTLGVQEAPHSVLVNTLTSALRARCALLILDNCEHLIDACARLAEVLLRGCPHLKIIATSREPLRVPGEVTYIVPPFTTPDLARRSDPISLTKYASVCLFVERAASSKPGFVMGETNALDIAQACHRVDGIPLAIELAAARVKVLPVAQIVKRLDERFHLLTSGARTALPQHQTLRSTMDWSYDLLTETEQVLFRRLAVFVGGFTLDASEAVCAGEQIETDDVLDVLAELVSKSLVVAGGTDREVRYRLLDTVQRYAQEKLDEFRETTRVRERHRVYFLEFAEGIEPDLQGPEQAARLEQLETEHDNLRAALAWSVESGNTVNALRLSGALWRFWYIRGYHREGREWLEDALASSGGVLPALRAKALDGAGYLATDQADYAAAFLHFEESLSIHRALGDKAGVAESLHGLGRAAWRKGDFERAAGFYEEALVFRKDLGATNIIPLVLNSLATLAMATGDLPKAASLLRESLAMCRRRLR